VVPMTFDDGGTLTGSFVFFFDHDTRQAIWD
jgi:hypothetical protein